jgi:hypothetical protein
VGPARSNSYCRVLREGFAVQTTEYLHRNYLREEEFLDEFYESASAARSLLQGEWTPDPGCNDAVRKNRDYFFSSGELTQLVFDAAAVFHTANGRFSSVQISLRSAKRQVTVRVRAEADGTLTAEKIVDREHQ